MHNAELVKRFGATHVVDRTLPPAAVVAEVQRLAGGLIELVYDAISLPETKNLGYEIAAPGGSLVIINPEFLDGHKMPEGRGVNVVTGLGVVSVPENREYGATLAVEIGRLLEQGLIKVRR